MIYQELLKVCQLGKFSGDGSTTTFTLNQTVSSPQEIVVSVDGVVQEPTGAYTVPDGTTLTFSAAPSNNSGNNIFVMFFGRTFGTVTPAAENKGNFKSGGIFRTNCTKFNFKCNNTCHRECTSYRSVNICIWCNSYS